MALNLISAAFFLFVAVPRILGAGEVESVPDLEKAMYLTVEGYPCVRLLNLSGEIGCSNPGSGKVVAPIVRFGNAHDQLDRLSTVLISIDEMQSFFLRVSSDLYFAQKVAGVLVEPSNLNKSIGFSPVEKFPQAAFAPYQSLNYEWNPTGSGIMWNSYDFPVFLLSEKSASIVHEIVIKNMKDNTAYLTDVAEFDLVMQTTKVGTHDSESCLKEGSCLPLGGYSVWSSLPPINISSLGPPKPILLTIVSQDSASFFRDKSIGADSPLSGLIALLAAVDALSNIGSLDKLQKQLVFAVFTGEAWGYLGSRRFLHELDIGTDGLKGLNGTLIEQVLEIGSVGKGSGEGVTTFYAHTEVDSSKTKEMLNALQKASVSLGTDNVKMKRADASNPGLPPSSMMAFLRKNKSTSGVVLEEFDGSFSNKFYHSHLDNPSNINSSSIAAAAILAARAIYILATGDLTLNLIALNSIKINMSLVEELVACLLTCEPGLSCALVKKFISPSNTCPSHYVGVFLGVPSNIKYVQYPEYVDDTSRFVWNFLADRTAAQTSNASSCTGECDGEGEVCIGAEPEGIGRCMISTTRYIPAYSTRLTYEGNSWQVIPADASDSMGLVDPVWTESYWGTLGLRIYKVQSSAYDHLVLLGGVAVTAAAYIAVIVTRTCLVKALKHD
ncbi:nicastrin protein [Dioscorea alata]|uniref:Nicastrin protein n=1 Tax=Dioscorea alata TaxID=55571 RepID=A0ACB7VYV9_DIOAL|nr:nicastrin protein [Dioscorea alata]